MTSRVTTSGERTGKAKAAELSEQELGKAGGSFGIYKISAAGSPAGDGTDDIIVAAGPGANAHVK